MVEKIEDIKYFFFDQIRKRGKYEVKFEGNSAFIIPRDEETYYKPVIVVKDLTRLEDVLYEYIATIERFYKNSERLKEQHDTGYFFSALFFNMTNSDAEDLEKYIRKRISFLNDNFLTEFDSPHLLYSDNNAVIFGQREISLLGFESPYAFKFFMNIDEKSYNLPLIRYAIDDNHVCHLFSVQFDRCFKNDNQDESYKKTINTVNSGVKKYRNVQPSFVLVLKLFLELLEKEGIKEIVAPDYLFSRYRKYYKTNSVSKSDKILERILNDYILLLQRMEYQFPFFEIVSYPNEIDSYTHIKLNNSIDVDKKMILK